MPDTTTSDKLIQNYSHYYDAGPTEWRRLGALDKARNIRTLAQSLPHSTILEIGAGDGAVLAQLSQDAFGDHYHAVEISQSAVDVIRARAIPRLVECQLFDGYNTAYANKQFDLVILTHVLEHVEHPRMLLAEANRLAKHVFVEVPLEDNARLKHDFVWDAVGHINFYSPRTIRHLVQSCGLQVLNQITVNPSYASYRHLNPRKAFFHYWAKQMLLKATPSIATKILTYNGALIARSSDNA